MVSTDVPHRHGHRSVRIADIAVRSNDRDWEKVVGPLTEMDR